MPIKQVVDNVPSDTAKSDSFEAESKRQALIATMDNQGKRLHEIKYYVKRGSSGKLVAMVAVDELPVELEGVPRYLEQEDTNKMVFLGTLGKKHSFAIGRGGLMKVKKMEKAVLEEAKEIRKRGLQEADEVEKAITTIVNETTNPTALETASLSKIATARNPLTTIDTQAISAEEEKSAAPPSVTNLLPMTSSNSDNILSTIRHTVSVPFSAVNNLVTKRGRGFINNKPVNGQHSATLSNDLTGSSASDQTVSVS
jgi:hypothetical protein